MSSPLGLPLANTCLPTLTKCLQICPSNLNLVNFGAVLMFFIIYPIRTIRSFQILSKLPSC